MAKILVGNRREEHNARGTFSVVFLALCFINPLGQIGTEGVRAVVEGLVVTPERQNNVGLGNLEVRVGARETVVAWSIVHLVAAEAMVAEHQFLFGRSGLNIAF